MISFCQYRDQAVLYLVFIRFVFGMQELFTHFLVKDGHWVVELHDRKQPQ